MASLHDTLPPEITPLTDPAAAAPKGAMLTVFLVTVIDLLGFGIVLPLLPRYAETYLPHYTDPQKYAAIGVVLSAFSLMQFLFAPLWGRLSDRIGRRPVLLIGLGGSTLAYLGFGLASELDPADRGELAMLLILLTRVFAGVAGATIAVAQAVIADCTTPATRSRGMALIGMAFGIGFTLGPLLAALALAILPGERGVPGYLAASWSLMALLLGGRVLPETRREGVTAPASRGWLRFGQLFATLGLPTVGRLVATFFLATLGFAMFESTLAVLAHAALGISEKQNYILFAYVGLVLAFAQGYVYRKLAKTVDDVVLTRLGVALMMAGLLMLTALTMALGESPQPPYLGPWLMLALAVAVFGFAFVTPSVQALISKRGDPTRQGEVLGVNQSFAALARIAGPLLGLWLFGYDSSRVLPYLVAALVLGSGLVLLRRLKN